MNITNFKPGIELTFKTVVAEHAKLLKALTEDDKPCFCLDLSEVIQCDSAGLALLIEAKKLCQQNDKAFTIKGISPEALSLAEFCGVKSIL
ncbi:MAG: STAS domain-containing protein [Legionella sp.]|nr:STAS domain-containing protein [Legionella sp.]